MELMKVIQFPKKVIEEKETNERLDKVEVAKKLLDILADEKIDFSIVIDKNSALKVLEDNENYRDYIVITTNEEESRKMLLKLTQMRNSCLINIKGDEL
jgi:hypothetical protein